ARLHADVLYQEAAKNRGYDAAQKYGDFAQLIHTLTKQGLYGAYLLESYQLDEIIELSKVIQPDRDKLFNYIGLKVLSDRYLARDFDQQVMELPQERFMIIAMHLALNEQDRVGWAKKFYDVL